MLYGNATTENISYRSWERVLDTLLGVGIAYFFGLLVPALAQRRIAARSATPSCPHDGLLAGIAKGAATRPHVAQGEARSP